MLIGIFPYFSDSHYKMLRVIVYCLKKSVSHDFGHIFSAGCCITLSYTSKTVLRLYNSRVFIYWLMSPVVSTTGFLSSSQLDQGN
jgi:hypothetical protein